MDTEFLVVFFLVLGGMVAVRLLGDAYVKRKGAKETATCSSCRAADRPAVTTSWRCGFQFGTVFNYDDGCATLKVSLCRACSDKAGRKWQGLSLLPFVAFGALVSVFPQDRAMQARAAALVALLLVGMFLLPVFPVFKRFHMSRLAKARALQLGYHGVWPLTPGYAEPDGVILHTEAGFTLAMRAKSYADRVTANHRLIGTPEGSDGLLRSLRAKYDEGKLDEVIAELGPLLSSLPAGGSLVRLLSSAYSDRGAARTAAGAPADGLRDFESALHANPENWRALFNAGQLHVAAGHEAVGKELLARASVIQDSAAAQSPVVVEMDAAVAAIRRALAQGLAGAGEPLRPTGIQVMSFTREHQIRFRLHSDLLTGLARTGLLAGYKLWRLELDKAEGLSGLLFVTGQAEQITNYARFTYHLPDAEAFVAERCQGDWSQIEASSNESDVPANGCKLDLRATEKSLSTLASLVRPYADRIMAIVG